MLDHITNQQPCVASQISIIVFKQENLTQSRPEALRHKHHNSDKKEILTGKWLKSLNLLIDIAQTKQ